APNPFVLVLVIFYFAESWHCCITDLSLDKPIKKKEAHLEEEGSKKIIDSELAIAAYQEIGLKLSVVSYNHVIGACELASGDLFGLNYMLLPLLYSRKRDDFQGIAHYSPYPLFEHQGHFKKSGTTFIMGFTG
ncbi:hypothetical protein ACJX0J_005976, partial [Zea mays]